MGAYDNLIGLGNSLNDLATNITNAYIYTRTQDENLEENHNLRDMLFEREDNAVQRRAKDLQAAGLSKTLAAGSAAQASAPQPYSKDPYTLKAFDAVNLQSQIQSLRNLRSENALMHKNMDKADAEITNLNASSLKENQLAGYYGAATTTQGTQAALNNALANKAAQDILTGQQTIKESGYRIGEIRERTKGYSNERRLKAAMSNFYTQLSQESFSKTDNLFQQRHFLEQQILHLANTDAINFERLGLQKAQVVQSYLKMALDVGVDVFGIIAGHSPAQAPEPHNPIGF